MHYSILFDCIKSMHLYQFPSIKGVVCFEPLPNIIEDDLSINEIQKLVSDNNDVNCTIQFDHEFKELFNYIDEIISYMKDKNIDKCNYFVLMSNISDEYFGNFLKLQRSFCAKRKQHSHIVTIFYIKSRTIFRSTTLRIRIEKHNGYNGEIHRKRNREENDVFFPIQQNIKHNNICRETQIQPPPQIQQNIKHSNIDCEIQIPPSLQLASPIQQDAIFIFIIDMVKSNDELKNKIVSFLKKELMTELFNKI